MTTLTETPILSLHTQYLDPLAFAAMEAEQDRQNFITDLTDLCEKINSYLNIADDRHSEDPNALSERFQNLSHLYQYVTTKYGADLNA
ncbi:MAG: hypothetical protein HC851_22545 [Acaryochloris sp. RU_4_1]|nr:hypothetical protein [Acaryochloris sp. RU_4_1]NJR56681.1 hypothetical protein [Acaryochloris sp. CRU_2_0]